MEKIEYLKNKAYFKMKCVTLSSGIISSLMIMFNLCDKVCPIIDQKTEFWSMIGLPNLLDKFIDITGHEIDWHDREDGWTEDRRKKIWIHNLLMTNQLKKLPAFTKSGYKKMSIPTELYKLILQILKQNSTKYIDEELNDHHFLSNWQRIYPDGSKEPKRNTMTYDLCLSVETKMKNEVLSTLLPILESWSGQKLMKYGTVYGRRYLRGASMLMHVDAFFDSYNHISNYFAVILQINQKVEKEWPLTLKDNEDQNKKIILKPGEMLLYESAKVPHGRQFPLEGEYYENILVHFGIHGAQSQTQLKIN